MREGTGLFAWVDSLFFAFPLSTPLPLNTASYYPRKEKQ